MTVLPSLLAGVGVSAVAWYVLTYVPFFRFFAAVFVGIAVGDVMTRVAKRHTNTLLEVGAVVAVVLGWVLAAVVRTGGNVDWIFNGGERSGVYVALPLLLASYFAYTRVR